MSKFGVQPAHELITASGRTVRGTARVIEVPFDHLRNTLRGTVRPRPEVKDRLSELLSRPVEDLFTPEALAKPYDGSKNPWKSGVDR